MAEHGEKRGCENETKRLSGLCPGMKGETMGIEGIGSSAYRMNEMEIKPKEQVVEQDPEAVEKVSEVTVNKDEAAKDGSEKDEFMSESEKQKRMERLQDTLKDHNVEISYNEEVNRYAIKILDSNTKEVVKEIPSEKTLDMFARMLEIEGLLVDEKR